MSRQHRADRRKLNPVSLSFLDVMFCGFGAVILTTLILGFNSTQPDEGTSLELAAEINLLQEEVQEGHTGLVRLRNTVSEVDLEVVEAQGLARQIQQRVDTFLQQLAALENSSTATVEDLQQLRADVQQLKEDLLRLQADAIQQEGTDVRRFLGNGQRQYLSGLYLGGQRILIVVDSSASMLDDNLVNIIRTNLRADVYKKEAPKWQRAIKIVDWITTQLPITSRYQIYTFNEQVRAALPGSDGDWLEVADRDQLDEAVAQVMGIAPGGGTNLEGLLKEVADMSPPPDNIFLLTDGLPTVDDRGGSDTLVRSRDRVELFEEALGELVRGIPFNIILLPLEGDPEAAAAFWQLAVSTRGSLVMPSSDWPAGSSAVQQQVPDEPREETTVARVQPTEQVSEDQGVRFPANI